MLRQRAQAKVNLTLRVLGRRADGYHELESLVTFADVHDVVTLEPGAENRVTVAGPFAHDIGGENLLARALTLLRDAEPRLGLGSVNLEKNLPVAAGLGGGSADAAALVRAVRHSNPGHAANVPWLDIASKLGADVPVCMGDRPALMWGMGENIAPVPHLPQVQAVIVNPRLPLSTADVFRELGAAPAATSMQPPVPSGLLQLNDLLGYMQARGNDLERPAARLLPAIGEIKAALAAQPGCLLAAMSGSGPTCFGIFADPAHARLAADHIGGAHGGWWVKATMLQGSPAAVRPASR